MNTPDKHLKKTRFIGPGTVVALIAVLAIGLWNIRYMQPGNRPIQNVVTSSDFKPPAGPQIEDLIKYGAQLKLSTEQISQLRAIQSDWSKESKPIIHLLEKRSIEMQKYMNSAAKSNPTMEDIQRHAQSFSETSAQYANLRKTYNEKAISILTSEQTVLWNNISQEKRNRNENNK